MSYNNANDLERAYARYVQSLAGGSFNPTAPAPFQPQAEDYYTRIERERQERARQEELAAADQVARQEWEKAQVQAENEWLANARLARLEQERDAHAAQAEAELEQSLAQEKAYRRAVWMGERYPNVTESDFEQAWVQYIRPTILRERQEQQAQQMRSFFAGRLRSEF